MAPLPVQNICFGRFTKHATNGFGHQKKQLVNIFSHFDLDMTSNEVSQKESQAYTSEDVTDSEQEAWRNPYGDESTTSKILSNHHKIHVEMASPYTV